MNLHSCILTGNDCYKADRWIAPAGVMVHSTGVNNPNLRRYVQPDDGLLGTNPNGNDWNRSGTGACVHAFIGKLADGTIATYQTLPWTMRSWHCGGDGNNTHISFEICEDGLEDEDYFRAVYRKAVELTAHLCKEYGLDPLEDGVVICHQEGYRRGIASNHGDVLHWFPKFGKSMDDFRQDVKEEMESDMSEQQFYEMFLQAMAKYTKKLESKEVSAWAKEAWERAVEAGLFDGSMPQAPLTREQAAAIIARMEG